MAHWELGLLSIGSTPLKKYRNKGSTKPEPTTRRLSIGFQPWEFPQEAGARAYTADTWRLQGDCGDLHQGDCLETSISLLHPLKAVMNGHKATLDRAAFSILDLVQHKGTKL